MGVGTLGFGGQHTKKRRDISMLISVVMVLPVAAVQLCPEELGMWDQTLAGFGMELPKAAVGSFGSRQLRLAMRFLQPCVFLLTFGVLQSFCRIENRHKHKPRYAHGREVL